MILAHRYESTETRRGELKLGSVWTLDWARLGRRRNRPIWGNSLVSRTCPIRKHLRGFVWGNELICEDVAWTLRDCIWATGVARVGLFCGSKLQDTHG